MEQQQFISSDVVLDWRLPCFIMGRFSHWDLMSCIVGSVASKEAGEKIVGYLGGFAKLDMEDPDGVYVKIGVSIGHEDALWRLQALTRGAGDRISPEIIALAKSAAPQRNHAWFTDEFRTFARIRQSLPSPVLHWDHNKKAWIALIGCVCDRLSPTTAHIIGNGRSVQSALRNLAQRIRKADRAGALMSFYIR